MNESNRVLPGEYAAEVESLNLLTGVPPPPPPCGPFVSPSAICKYDHAYPLSIWCDLVLESLESSSSLSSDKTKPRVLGLTLPCHDLLPGPFGVKTTGKCRVGL